MTRDQEAPQAQRPPRGLALADLETTGGPHADHRDALTADRDNQYLMIDSTIVRAHPQAATGKGGRKIRRWGVPEAD
jgi:hypothetical protein